jgi:hypothetical protein
MDNEAMAKLGGEQLARLWAPIFWEAERSKRNLTRGEYGCLLLHNGLQLLGLRVQQQNAGMARVLGHLQRVGAQTEVAMTQAKEQRRAERKQQRRDTKRRRSR